MKNTVLFRYFAFSGLFSGAIGAVILWATGLNKVFYLDFGHLLSLPVVTGISTGYIATAFSNKKISGSTGVLISLSALALLCFTIVCFSLLQTVDMTESGFMTALIGVLPVSLSVIFFAFLFFGVPVALAGLITGKAYERLSK